MNEVGVNSMREYWTKWNPAIAMVKEGLELASSNSGADYSGYIDELL